MTAAHFNRLTRSRVISVPWLTRRLNRLTLVAQLRTVNGHSRSDGKFTVTESWKRKAQGYMSTPVVIDGVAYTHLKSQRVMAIEVATGRELWTSDQSFGKYMSLVAQADRVLALDQRGQLFLFRANQEKFDLLDQRKLSDAETWAHLAVAGDELFVRELNALTAFRWSHPGPANTTAARQ